MGRDDVREYGWGVKCRKSQIECLVVIWDLSGYNMIGGSIMIIHSPSGVVPKRS